MVICGNHDDGPDGKKELANLIACIGSPIAFVSAVVESSRWMLKITRLSSEEVVFRLSGRMGMFSCNSNLHSPNLRGARCLFIGMGPLSARRPATEN